MVPELSEAIDRLYAAAVEPGGWRAALQTFSESIDAVGCLFVPQQNAETLLELPISPEMDELASVYVKDGWYKRDLRAIRGWKLVEQGRDVVFEHDIGTAEERARHEYYQDLCRPLKILWWAALKVDTLDKRWAVAIHRAPHQEPFGPSDVKGLKAVAPHFARAVTLSEQLALSSAGGSIDILERFGLGCFLIDWRGRVVRMNARAKKLLGHGLAIRQGKLAAGHRDSNAALQRLLAAALRPGPASALPVVPPIAIAREHKRPLVVDAIPIAGAVVDVFHQVKAILTIKNPDDEERRSAGEASALLHAMFGLTAAEARLAIELGSGGSLWQAADALRVTYDTARSQLRTVFSKTGTHRQGELVALLASVSAGKRSTLVRDAI